MLGGLSSLGPVSFLHDRTIGILTGDDGSPLDKIISYAMFPASK